MLSDPHPQSATRRVRVLFVDDEPLVLRSIRRALMLDHSYRAFTAEGGEEALVFLGENQVDIVVSDVRMPGMDGVELLGLVKEHYPAIMRVALTGYADTTSMIGLTTVAHRYLSKPIDPKELGKTLSVLAAVLPDIGSPRVLSLIEGAVPPAQWSILKTLAGMLEDEAIDGRHIAEVIGQDATLASKVLQLANSPLFGARKAITELEEATQTVGLDILRPLVLMAGPHTPEVRTLEDVVEHSLKVALLTEAFAPEDKYTARTAGLLHDIGRSVIDNLSRDDHPEIQVAMDEGGQHGPSPILIVNGEGGGVTHIDHATIGSVLLSLWGVAPQLVTAVRHHHRLDAVPEENVELAVVLHVADALASTGSQHDQLLHIDRVRELGFGDKLTTWMEMAKELLRQPLKETA